MAPPSAAAPTSASWPDWSLIAVAGHPCAVHVPDRPLPGRAVVYLHDVDELPAPAAAGLRGSLERCGLPVLAPLSGRSWWLDRIVPGFDPRLTPERFVLDHVRAEAERRFAAGPGSVALVGVANAGLLDRVLLRLRQQAGVERVHHRRTVKRINSA